MAAKKRAVQITSPGNKTTPKKTAKNKHNESLNTILNGGEKAVGRMETTHFLSGILLLIGALFTLLAFTSHLFTGGEDQKLIQTNVWFGKASNWAGVFGAHWASFWMDDRFGLAAFFIPLFLLMVAMKLTRAYKVRLWKWFLNCCFLLVWFSVSASYFLTTLFSRNPSISYLSPGGGHGEYIVEKLSLGLGSIGVAILLIFTALIYCTYLSSETIRIVRKMLNPVDYIKSKMPHKEEPKQEEEHPDEDTTGSEPTEKAYPDDTFEESAPASETESDEEIRAAVIDFDISTPDAFSAPQPDDTDEPYANVQPEQEETDNKKENKGDEDELSLSIEPVTEEEMADDEGKGPLEPFDPKLDLENYQYPILQLLDKHENSTGSTIDMEEQNKNKDQIIQALQNFGVGISSIKATVGPTITLYEITPAPGVRISKIRNLEDDIALSLSALGIRIIAPIPGKGTIGIEVPNARPQMVSMESILNSKKFQDTEYELPIALGKTITNEVFMVDLAKMPHLLVAGATGQGKSVGLNAIVTSLLYKKHPAELKFVMVDPKKVEFSIYSPIENHFLAKVAEDNSEPIITDVNKVVQTLKSLCVEMDTRYDLLKKARARNVKEYNAKFKNRQLNPENGHRFMPYIVVVIDEFGDLIMTAGKEIELPIARIAQLARAVGIHMIIATQRPTTNIITGTIKANFPARMAFKVSAMIDSRTILDRPGANQLIGRGDMLFSSGTEPVRVQCAFVDTPEVERITAYIARQQSYLGPFELPKVEMEGEEDGGAASVDITHLDPLFEEAARLIVTTQQGSTSMIQRKFAIGYNRAGRLMDQLERTGIVGSAQGSKPREVLCVDETDLEMRLNNLR